MTPAKKTTIHEAFDALQDPRQEWKVEHPLVNLSHRLPDGDCRTDRAAGWGHLVLNLLRLDKSFKGGIPAKRLKCAWEVTYRLRILQQLFSPN